MAYPTSPSQVGLTVAKSELEFFDTASSRTLQTESASYENKIFRGTTLIFEVDNLTFTNCWFYATSGFWLVYGAGNPQNIRFINCEFGLSSSDSTVYDPDGFAGTCSDKGLGLMQWKAYDCYSHHQSDGHYVGSGTVVDHCYMHDSVYTGPEGSLTVHIDILQFTGQDDVTVTRSYLANLLAADNVLVPSGGEGDDGNQTAAIFIQSQSANVNRVEVSDCYLDGEGFFTLRTSVPGFAVDDVVWVRNRFGRSYPGGGGPTSIDPATTNLFRYDNRFADDLSLTPGDQAMAVVESGTVNSNGRFNLSVPLDSSTFVDMQADDVLYVFQQVRTTTPDSTLAPSGFVDPTGAGFISSTTGGGQAGGVARRVITAADVATPPTWNFLNGTGDNDLVRIISWILVRGADTTTPERDTDRGFNASFTTSPPGGSVSVEADDIVLTWIGVGSASIAFTPPTGYDEETDSNFSSASQSLASKTATSTTTESPTFTTAGGQVNTYLAVSVQPASVAAPTGEGDGITTATCVTGGQVLQTG